MDPKNLFHTPTTYRLVRAEYLVALVVCAVIAMLHIGQIRWIPFIGLFVYIDLIGYLPGVVAHLRSHDAYLARRYYVLYNTMHSLITAGAVAGLWCVVVRPEWALLALPLHLFGDRSIFGNFYKSFGIEFEPSAHPDYAAVKPKLDRPRRSRSAVVPGLVQTAAATEMAVR
jgi:hypothetical protein